MNTATAASIVAQIFNLPYRRIAFCGSANSLTGRNLRRSADCKSAIQQIGNLRYAGGRLQRGFPIRRYVCVELGRR
ncbi:MAG: hypothetical protein HY735_24795 [Verrucomicrobia bacterium]|nr:hypothetical protein [Verrucomicrobiota bacterium]